MAKDKYKRQISAEDFNMMTKHETTDDLEALLDGVPATRLDVSHVQRGTEKVAVKLMNHINEATVGGTETRPATLDDIRELHSKAERIEQGASSAHVTPVAYIALVLALVALGIAIFN